MKMRCAVVAWLLLASAVSAQTVPPALMVKEGNVSKPLGLTKLATEVRIFGSVAETTTTMTFSNPMGRVMEGELYFPLPEGATVSGYALDIAGKMIDGVVVEKHKARQVFEEIVRQGVDPGLVQWTKGNNFQTRVYPIPANGVRTVRVRYVSELIGGKDAPAYHLPLKFKEKIPEFSLRVEVVKPTAVPVVAKGGLANFSFKKWRDNYVAETKQQNWTTSENLVIALPKVEGPQVLVEKADDGQFYFAIQDYPTAPATTQTTRPTPRHVVVFWDASGSRAGDHQREIALLKAYLEQWPVPERSRREPSRKHPSDVTLVELRNDASEPKRFDFHEKGIQDLLAELKKIQYDGGTQLGAIGPVGKRAGKSTHYLLFTDGISNFGREEPGRLDGPLQVFSAAATANYAFMRRLAITNGGQYFNLTRWKDADILAQLGRPAWSFLSASIEGGDAKDVYPQLPEPLAGRFVLAGKLQDETAAVTVRYGHAPGDSPNERTFKVSRADAVEGSLLRRLWAEKKLAELMIHEKKNEKQIVALGKQYGLVTPYTSLLVLDSLDQYVEYEIAPPKSLGSMREEYLQRVDTLEHQRRKKKADKLTQVVQMWNQRVKWWNQKFTYPENFKYQEKKSDKVALPGVAAPEAAVPRTGTSPSRNGTADLHMRSTEPRGMGGMGMGGGGMGGAMSPPAESAGEGRPPRPMLLSPQLGGSLGKSGDDSKLTDRRQPGISIKAWDPKTPYLKQLKAVKDDGDYLDVYMKNRAKFGNSPAFFLECADFFREKGHDNLALRVLSNLAELELEDPAVLRVLGHRLAQIGRLDLAIQTFETVLDLRPEEPQSFRDLALVLARRAGEKTKNDAPPATIHEDYARTIDLLTQVVLRHWDGRFEEIEVMALEEINHILPKAKEAGVSTSQLDPRLVKLLDVDIRIVMTWHADQTDIDLWVTEPSGEKAYYQHNRTTIGGLVSRDFTGGYGPEEYLVRRAAKGKYKIEANYYGSRAVRLLGPVTVQVDVYTNYGRKNEQKKSLTLRLEEEKKTATIGEIEF
ncbi:MAG: DUF2135 domain-containing protein [Pirellulales bacterium]|nr:DUF2135 domain-containing protein [Pirellulales bacterium]